MVAHDDLVRFVQRGLGSVWALRLLITLSHHPTRSWDIPSLVRELRASSYIVERLLPRFLRIGLVVRTDAGRWKWQPANDEMDRMARRVRDAYEVTPFTVIQMIAESPDDHLRHFADAFRFRRKSDDDR